MAEFVVVEVKATNMWRAGGRGGKEGRKDGMREGEAFVAAALLCRCCGCTGAVDRFRYETFF